MKGAAAAQKRKGAAGAGPAKKAKPGGMSDTLMKRLNMLESSHSAFLAQAASDAVAAELQVGAWGPSYTPPPPAAAAPAAFVGDVAPARSLRTHRHRRLAAQAATAASARAAASGSTFTFSSPASSSGGGLGSLRLDRRELTQRAERAQRFQAELSPATQAPAQVRVRPGALPCCPAAQHSTQQAGYLFFPPAVSYALCCVSTSL